MHKPVTAMDVFVCNLVMGRERYCIEWCKMCLLRVNEERREEGYNVSVSIHFLRLWRMREKFIVYKYLNRIHLKLEAYVCFVIFIS